MRAATTSLSLRAPKSDERPALVDLWVKSWRVTFPEIDFRARAPWLIEHLARLERDGAQIVCAFDGAAMAGFVTIDPGRQWLDQLCVHPNAFGSGAARALLNAAQKISPEKIGLDVNADNFRARRFYEREGFVTIGESVNPQSGRKTVVLEWSSARE